MQTHVCPLSSSSEGSNLTPAHHYNDFRFKTYAPVAFRYFRELFGIRPDDYLVRLPGARGGSCAQCLFGALGAQQWMRSVAPGFAWCCLKGSSAVLPCSTSAFLSSSSPVLALQ